MDTLKFATRPRTRDPLDYAPDKHGHALILAPLGAGRSTMLRYLIKQALADASGEANTRVTILAPLADASDWAQEAAQGATLGITPQECRTALHDALALLEQPQQPTDNRQPLVLFVDDVDHLPDQLRSDLARIRDEGADAGVYLVLVAPGPVDGLLDHRHREAFGFRAARRLSLTVVQELMSEPQERFVPAPMVQGRWLVHVAGQFHGLVWEYAH